MLRTDHQTRTTLLQKDLNMQECILQGGQPDFCVSHMMWCTGAHKSAHCLSMLPPIRREYTTSNVAWAGGSVGCRIEGSLKCSIKDFTWACGKNYFMAAWDLHLQYHEWPLKHPACGWSPPLCLVLLLRHWFAGWAICRNKRTAILVSWGTSQTSKYKTKKKKQQRQQ